MKCEICGKEVKKLAEHKRSIKCLKAKLAKVQQWREAPVVKRVSIDNRPSGFGSTTHWSWRNAFIDYVGQEEPVLDLSLMEV